MRSLAAQFSSVSLSSRIRRPVNVRSRQYSSSYHEIDERAMEEEAEKKIGWLFKLIFAGTATIVGYHIFPYLDEKRMKIVELGGAQKLVDMLGAATDDRTRKEALSAIVAIAHADEAVGALQRARAISVIMATPESTEDAEIERYKGKLLRRLGDVKYDENLSSN